MKKENWKKHRKDKGRKRKTGEEFFLFYFVFISI